MSSGITQRNLRSAKEAAKHAAKKAMNMGEVTALFKPVPTENLAYTKLNFNNPHTGSVSQYVAGIPGKGLIPNTGIKDLKGGKRRRNTRKMSKRRKSRKGNRRMTHRR
jgi:hypothetical protein